MTMRPGHRHGRAALAGALVLAFAAAPALATTPSTPSPPAPARAQGGPVATATGTTAKPTPVPAPAPAPLVTGLMAFLDPDTGLLTGPISHLVPPADQQAASANVLLEPVRRANGAWLLDLKGTLMEHYVIHIDPLGNRRVLCVQDPRLPHVHGPQPLPAPAGEVR